MKKLKVTVDGKAYEVLVEEIEGGTPAPAAPVSRPAAAPVSAPTISAPAPSASAAPAAAGPGDVLSPLSGRVVAVNCAVGAAVEAGTTLITLEAMKMNTYVQAEKAGTVKAVLVKEGDGVEEGQPLVSIE